MSRLYGEDTGCGTPTATKSASLRSPTNQRRTVHPSAVGTSEESAPRARLRSLALSRSAASGSASLRGRWLRARAAQGEVRGADDSKG